LHDVEKGLWRRLQKELRVPNGQRGLHMSALTESAFIAAALRAGGAATHGAMALKFCGES